jgi:hypothetical protein
VDWEVGDMIKLEVREISVVSLFHWELQLFPRHIPSALRPAGAVVEVTKGKLGLYFFFGTSSGVLIFCCNLSSLFSRELHEGTRGIIIVEGNIIKDGIVNAFIFFCSRVELHACRIFLT